MGEEFYKSKLHIQIVNKCHASKVELEVEVRVIEYSNEGDK